MKKLVFLLIGCTLLLLSAINFVGCKQATNEPAKYTVTFETNGGSAVTAITGIASGAKIIAPTAPTKSGYVFVSWYKEAALTNEWNFATNTVTANITLYAKWATAEWALVGASGFSGTTVAAFSFALNGTTPYAATSLSDKSLNVYSFDGSAWQKTGSDVEAASTNSINYPFLAFNGTGTPYVSYGYATSALYVQKFDGSAWSKVGNSINNTGGIYGSMAFDSSGAPYAAYKKPDLNGLTVYKYSGSSWGAVGSAFSSAENESNIVFYNNEPYIAVCEGNTAKTIKLYKYSGTAWVQVGATISAGNGNFGEIYIAVDSTGTWYIAYTIGSPKTFGIKKYKSATEWDDITSGITGVYIFSSMAMKNDVPYIAYSDGNIKVKKYNGTAWVQVGGDVDSGYPLVMNLNYDATSALLYIAYNKSSKVFVQRIPE